MVRDVEHFEAPPDCAEYSALYSACTRSTFVLYAGSIPPQLGELMALESLILRMNQLAGERSKQTLAVVNGYICGCCFVIFRAICAVSP